MNNPLNCVRNAKTLNVYDRFVGLLKKFYITRKVFFHSQRLEGDGYYLDKCDHDQVDVVVAVPVAGQFFKFKGERLENYLSREEVEMIFGIEPFELADYLRYSCDTMLKFVLEAEQDAARVEKDLRVFMPEIDMKLFDESWAPAKQVLRYIKNYTTAEETTQLEKVMNICFDKPVYDAIRLARYDHSRGNSNEHKEALLVVLRHYNDGDIKLDRYPVSYLDLYRWLSGFASPEVLYEIRTRKEYMFNQQERTWFSRASSKL